MSIDPNYYSDTFTIPPLPHTQCLSTETFAQPPIDGSLSVPELYDWHLVHSKEHPMFVYADDDNNPKVIFWPEGVRAVHRTARLIQQLGQDTGTRRPVVAILAAAGKFHNPLCFIE